MSDITVKYLDQMERYIGSFEHGQQFFFAGKSLGLSKLGMNAIRIPPNWEHYPEHTTPQTTKRSFILRWRGAGRSTQRGRPIQCSVAS